MSARPAHCSSPAGIRAASFPLIEDLHTVHTVHVKCKVEHPHGHKRVRRQRRERMSSLILHSTQMQTRSADEPMTTFVTCLNCGNRWKE